MQRGSFGHKIDVGECLMGVFNQLLPLSRAPEPGDR